MIRGLFCAVLLLFGFQSKAYWQQEVNYQIAVTLDDQNHQLRGTEQIVYINNSPDTLRNIFFHLWPNAYQHDTPLAKQLLKQGNTNLYFQDSSGLGFIDSLSFKVNGKKVAWNFAKKNSELAIIALNEGLVPGDSILIQTPFRVHLPEGDISRLGHVDQAYQITQWYPKPVVYDKDGWHPMNYLNQGEFYSEFGSFEVQITLPENYMIAATGELKGAGSTEELSFIRQRAGVTREVEAGHGLPLGLDSVPESSPVMKTLTFYQDRVHDFAWFANKRWLVQIDSVQTKRDFRWVKIYTYFLPENKTEWAQSSTYVKDGIAFYSEKVGDYPYTVCTAVDGSIAAGGGMEYPTITIIGEAENQFMLEETIVHEVGHNWFYGILGNNERIYPWMDEGINSYYERAYFEELHPNSNLSDMIGFPLQLLLKDKVPSQSFYYYYAYTYLASRGLDIAGSAEASEFDDLGYAAIVYAKSAVLFHYLEDYIGKEKFDQAMQKYYQQWKFKHPQPTDLQYALQESVGEDLSWFFTDLLATNRTLDYQIGKAKTDGDTLIIGLSNHSSISAPVKLGLFRNDSLVKTVWVNAFDDEVVVKIKDEEFEEVRVDPKSEMPIVHRYKNVRKVNTFLGGIKDFDTNFLLDIPKSANHQMFYLPLFGYNSNDGFQVGIFLYNSLLEERRFRYQLMPQYGFKSNQLVGSFKGIYSWYPRIDGIARINLAGEYRNVGVEIGNWEGYFRKLEPKIQVKFQPKDDLEQSLQLRYTFTSTGLRDSLRDPNEYLTMNYVLNNKKVIHPYALELNAQWINFQGSKIWGEYRQSFTINKKLQALEVRLFGGYFPVSDGKLTHRFRLGGDNGAGALIASGNTLYNRGNSDYLNDEIYLARFDSPTNFLSQQVFRKDGGFRTGLYLGANSNWMAAVNLTIPTPSKYLSLWVDMGWFPNGTSAQYVYASGLQLNLIKGVFEVYLPFYYQSENPIFISREIIDNYSVLGLDNYFQKVKFLFNLSQFYGLLE